MTPASAPIEHGHIADEATIRLMAARGIWLSLQAFQVGDNPLTPEQIKKAEPTGHWDRVAQWAKTHGTKVAFGADLLFQPDGARNEPRFLTRFAKVFGGVGALRGATSSNCELFALSGERNPYKDAKLGILQRGAWADMLFVNGDPTKDISVLEDYEKNLVVIIKGGMIWKNTLSQCEPGALATAHFISSGAERGIVGEREGSGGPSSGITATLPIDLGLGTCVPRRRFFNGHTA